MAWAGFPATAATDWSSINFLNQFIEAINERKAALQNDPTPIGALTEVDIGDDVQAASFIAGLQDEIEGLFGVGLTWVTNQFWDGASYTPITDYHGLDPYTTLFGFAFQYITFIPGGGDEPNVCGSVLNIDGWTRKYPDGMGGTTTAYGQFQVGDYIGPHLWNEMKAVLGVMKWIEAAVFAVPIDVEYINADSNDTAPHATVAAAKAAAEADFDSQTPTVGSETASSAAYKWTELNEGGGNYGALLFTSRMQVAVDDVPTAVTTSVDFYAVAEDPGVGAVATFDGQGANLVDDKLGLFAAGVAVDGGGYGEASLYDMERGTNWPGTPTAETRSRGWICPIGRVYALCVCDFEYE